MIFNNIDVFRAVASVVGFIVRFKMRSLIVNFDGECRGAVDYTNTKSACYVKSTQVICHFPYGNLSL